ncbi:MAG: VWA domain-containing protein [Terriglobia bacterium]
MPVNSTSNFLKSALTLVLAGGFCGLSLFPSARAQEGVAGDNPVVSKPKQEPPADTKSSKNESQIRVTSNLVTAPVTVINSKGDFVFDLEEKDFEILDNGVRQRIEQFGLEQHRLAAVIVVEANSTSEPLLAEVRPLGPVFSSLMLGPQGEAAVITYGDQIRVVQDLTQDNDELESALRGLEAHGSAAHLTDALARAISLLESRPKENRRVIVVFSDGHDLGSETRKEEVVQRAVNEGITIYGLGFSPGRALLARQPKAPPPNPLDDNIARPLPPGTAPTPSNEEKTYDVPTVPIVPLILASGEMIRSTVAKSALEFYAGYTGGVCYAHWSTKKVQDELGRIADEIQSQYEIAYVPHAPSSENGFHRIQVHVHRSGVKVRTKAGYFLGGTNP